MDCSLSDKDAAVFTEAIVEKQLFFIDEVAEQFRATNNTQLSKSTKLYTCPHVAIFEDSRLTVCEHCCEKFCNFCMKEHLEKLAFDIELISNSVLFFHKLKSFSINLIFRLVFRSIENTPVCLQRWQNQVSPR